MASESKPRRFGRKTWIAVAVSVLAVAGVAYVWSGAFLRQIQRGRTKRNPEDVRAMSPAVEAYALAHGYCPRWPGEAGNAMSAMSAMSELAASVGAYALDHGRFPSLLDGPAHEALAPALVPRYLARDSAGEVWNYPLEYYSWTEASGAVRYQIIFRGADRLPPTGSGRYHGPGGVVTHCADDDLVIQDGVFLVRAEGRQDQCP